MESMYSKYKFESERLITRELTSDDAQNLFDMYSDADAMKFRGSKPMQSLNDALQMVSNQFSEEENTVKLRLGIVEKSDNKLIGTLLLSLKQETETSCEIGFSFGKEHWQKGFGQETLCMIEKELENRQLAHKIKAWCIKKNLASLKLFRKAGFEEIEQNQYAESILFEKELNWR